MSRSGYSDDFDCDSDYPAAFYRQAVRRATTGYRGQYLLRKLLAALDAMPVKRLIAGVLQDKSGEVCAFGALDPKALSRPPRDEDDDYLEEDYCADALAQHFNVAPALAAEIVYLNDEAMDYRNPNETPEERWTRMRAWVASQILPDSPPDVDAVDPVASS